MVDVTEQAKQAYKAAIISFLRERCKTDKYLAEACKKENKTLDGVVKFIIDEARKRKEDNIAVIADAEVYEMAVHYILEDSLDCEENKSEKIGADTNILTIKDEEAEEVSKEKPEVVQKQKKSKKTIADECQLGFGFGE